MQRKNTTYLDERFNLAPTLQLLSTHTLCHFPWVALDAGNNSMGIWSLLGAFVQLFDHDNLFAGLAALQDDCDLGGTFAISFWRNIQFLDSLFRVYILDGECQQHSIGDKNAELTSDHLEGRRGRDLLL